MMDTSTCTNLVLVLLWLYLCCQALGSLVTFMDNDNSVVLYCTTILSTLLLGLCLWQCKRAGYLVSPMTWYHWVLLVLLVILQVVAVVLTLQERLGLDLTVHIFEEPKYYIYGIAALIAVILGILGGTLFCGWKCNLFCRPCCKSQYICYGSAIVVVLLILTLVAAIASLIVIYGGQRLSGGIPNVLWAPQYMAIVLLPCTQCYAMALIWNTILRLPYTIPEVASLVASALAVASILASAILGSGKTFTSKTLSAMEYSFPALHIVSTGITWYLLEYKVKFRCPNQYLCFGLFTVVLVVALVAVVHTDSQRTGNATLKYTLLGYSIVLMVPTLWYAYRCGLLTWRWTSCHPKKKGLKATDTAEKTTPDTDIANE